MTAPVASLGLTRDPEGALAWALVAHDHVIIGPAPGPAGATELTLEQLANGVRSVHDPAEGPVGLTVTSGGDGAVSDELVQVVLDRLGILATDCPGGQPQ